MNDISHFSVLVDDVERAQNFYGSTFGWTFEAWGPPGFFLIHTSDNPTALKGALHERETPVTGETFCAFECTIAVDDVDRVSKAILEHGGTIVYEKAVIHGVGEIVRFKDTESNFLCAMRYDSSV